MTHLLRNTLLPFLLLATSIIIASYFVINSDFFLEMPDLLAMASTLDLTILIPIIYFLFIRKTTIPKITVIPVFILSYITANWLVPAEYQNTLSMIGYVIPIIELAVFSFLVYNIRKTVRAYKIEKHGTHHNGFLELIHSTTDKAFGEGLLAKVLATEISIFYYSLFAWKAPIETESDNTYSYYKENGYISFLAVIAFAMIAETFILHIWLSSWSITAAWILTGISIYSCFFLLGDLNATLKRPIYFSDKGLELRIGLRWRATIPVQTIESLTFRSPDKETETFANLVLTSEGNTVIDFNTEIVAQGPYGLKKKFKRLSIFLDDKAAFKAELDLLLSSQSLVSNDSFAKLNG